MKINEGILPLWVVCQAHHKSKFVTWQHLVIKNRSATFIRPRQLLTLSWLNLRSDHQHEFPTESNFINVSLPAVFQKVLKAIMVNACWHHLSHPVFSIFLIATFHTVQKMFYDPESDQTIKLHLTFPPTSSEMVLSNGEKNSQKVKIYPNIFEKITIMAMTKWEKPKTFTGFLCVSPLWKVSFPFY